MLTPRVHADLSRHCGGLRARAPSGPVASWFETRGVAAFLGLRPHPEGAATRPSRRMKPPHWKCASRMRQAARVLFARGLLISKLTHLAPWELRLVLPSSSCG